MELLASPEPRQLACLRVIHDALDELAGFDPDFMPTEHKRDYLQALQRAQVRLTAELMRVMAGAGDVAHAVGARSAARWLAADARLSPSRLVGAERLGERLRASYPVVLAALQTGEIGVEHARAIADVLDELPTDIPGCADAAARAALVERAQTDLVGRCADHTPHEIRILGRRILEVVAPDAADAIEQRLLEDEERRSRERTYLVLTPAGPGTTRLRGEIPDLHAAVLRAALEAFTNPRRDEPGSGDGAAGGGDADRRPLARRYGDALCSLLEHLPTDGLPRHGGSPVSIIATVDHRDLSAGLGAVTLSSGDRISASAVRRLACQHGLLPAVLGGAGEVLDLGRRRRLFSAAQRKAHQATHPTCQAAGCDVPAAWTEAHHRTAWADGGRTDLDELASLCSFHHHLAHDAAYATQWEGETVRFHRRE